MTRTNGAGGPDDEPMRVYGLRFTDRALAHIDAAHARFPKSAVKMRPMPGKKACLTKFPRSRRCLSGIRPRRRPRAFAGMCDRYFIGAVVVALSTGCCSPCLKMVLMGQS